MKDLENSIDRFKNYGQLYHQKYIAPKDTQFRDVVIIGNGPSGICLSYMLSGHWPYWLPDKVTGHPDEILRARLDYADATKSLVEQDLVELADGLEGRSTNPVSLLLDNLTHPCADLGMELPSMLRFENRPEKQIDHIVLGKGPPGGAWHRMDPNLRTLSLSAWMSLPGLDFHTWERMNGNETSQEAVKQSVEKSPLQRRNLALKSETNNQSFSNQKRKPCKEVQTRALISRVAAYYQDYVKEMGLETNFWNDVTVTNVFPVRIHGKSSAKAARWMVTGMRNGKQIHLACRNVVMANGSSDLANRLGLPVESLPWLKHELPQLEAALQKVPVEERGRMKPVMIVGAGLSAADAVTICRQSGIPVVHVYRSSTAGLDKMLPENVYPEYHEVSKMMKEPNKHYEYYTPVPEHSITALHPIPQSSGSHRVTAQHLVTGELRQFEISFCAILIGARPDLRFLHAPSLANFQSGHPPLIERHQNSCGGAALKENVGAYVHCFIEEECCDVQKVSRLARQISWFKIFCAKCRHINLCERTRRHDYKRVWEEHVLRCEYANATLITKQTMKLNTNLDFGLGEDPLKPIDGRNNPIAVDKFTNKVLRAPKGLFAMGPLVGDNFVRFIPGGALAITAALHREMD